MPAQVIRAVTVLNGPSSMRKRRAAPKFSCTPSGGLAKPGLGALSRGERDFSHQVNNPLLLANSLPQVKADVVMLPHQGLYQFGQIFPRVPTHP